MHVNNAFCPSEALIPFETWLLSSCLEGELSWETVFQINFLLVPSLLSSGLKQGKNERFKAKKANRILQSLAIYWQSRHRGIVVLNSVFSALALLRVHPNEPKNKYTQ